MKKLSHLFLVSGAVGVLMYFAMWLAVRGTAQIKEFRTDHAVIQEREQIPESVIEWADLHQVWEIKIEYGLEVRGRGITVLLFDGEGHVLVDYREKGDKQK